MRFKGFIGAVMGLIRSHWLPFFLLLTVVVVFFAAPFIWAWRHTVGLLPASVRDRIPGGGA